MTENMCRLAVKNADPNTVFDLTNSPEDKREMLYKTFEKAIAEAIADDQFSAGNTPQIKGFVPPRLAVPQRPAG